jgi:hypothetical protein
MGQGVQMTFQAAWLPSLPPTQALTPLQYALKYPFHVRQWCLPFLYEHPVAHELLLSERVVGYEA